MNWVSFIGLNDIYPIKFPKEFIYYETICKYFNTNATWMEASSNKIQIRNLLFSCWYRTTYRSGPKWLVSFVPLVLYAWVENDQLSKSLWKMVKFQYELTRTKSVLSWCRNQANIFLFAVVVDWQVFTWFQYELWTG